MSFTIAYDIKAIDKFTDVADRVYQGMARMDRSMKKVIEKNNKAAKSFDKMSKSAVKGSQRINKSLKKTEQAIDKQKKKVESLNRTFQKIGSGVQKTGSMMTKYLTLPIAATGGASIKMAMDFNKGMANVGTLIPGERKRLDGFKKDVLDLSVKMGMASDDLQGGLYQTLSAFGTLDDPMGKLEIAAKMGKAGMATTLESLNLLSAVTKGYGDTSDQAAQAVSDMAFQTVKAGQTTFPELAASMGRVVPIASALGVSQKELFTGFATLTGVTGTASEVSTQMASVLTAMSKPSEDLTKVVKKLGFQSASTMVKSLGLQRSLMMISKEVGGNSDKISQMLGRKEALVGMLALTGSQADVFRKKMVDMGNAIGATDQAYNEQVNGINASGAAWDRMKAKISKMLVTIGDKLLPKLEKLMMKYIDPLITKLENMDDATLDSALKFAGFAAVLGPVLAALGAIIPVVSNVVGFLGAKGLAGSLTFLTGPVGIAIGAIAALVAFVAIFWDELAPLRQALEGPLNMAFVTFKDILKTVGVAIKSVAALVGSLVKVVATLLAPFVKLIAYAAMLHFKAFISGAKIVISIVRALINVIRIIVNAVKLLFAWLAKVTIEWLNSSETGRKVIEVFKMIGQAAQKLIAWVADLWSTVEGFFSGIADWLGQAADDIDAAAERQAASARQGLKGGKMDITQRALATTNSNVNISMDINAPDGAVGAVKKKQSGGYANVNVGKNTRY